MIKYTLLNVLEKEGVTMCNIIPIDHTRKKWTMKCKIHELSDKLNGNKVIFCENAYEQNTDTKSLVNCLN